ncbi:MAG: FimB/Mfa2 family fimbrial subunit [Butyricimonas faecihominis]
MTIEASRLIRLKRVTCLLSDGSRLVRLQVVHSELNTLRLLENDDTRLILTHRSTGQRVLDIPLTKYLLLSREAYSGMTRRNTWIGRINIL